MSRRGLSVRPRFPCHCVAAPQPTLPQFLLADVPSLPDNAMTVCVLGKGAVTVGRRVTSSWPQSLLTAASHRGSTESPGHHPKALNHPQGMMTTCHPESSERKLVNEKTLAT